MKQGFDAWDFKRHKGAPRGAAHELSTPLFLIESDKLSQSPKGSCIEMPI